MPTDLSPAPWGVYASGPERLPMVHDANGRAMARLENYPTNGADAAAMAMVPTMLSALRQAETTIAATLQARGYQFGNSTDGWAAEVRSEVATLARLRFLLAGFVAPIATPADGPYRPELAEAFRIGARELCNSELGDKVEVPAGAIVEEAEGGAFVTVRLFVSDADRALMDGESDD